LLTKSAAVFSEFGAAPPGCCAHAGAGTAAFNPAAKAQPVTIVQRCLLLRMAGDLRRGIRGAGRTRRARPQ
jgi:hypothetical protein